MYLPGFFGRDRIFMRITYRQTPPATVFYARAHGPYASSSREAWQVLDAWLDQNAARRRARFGFGILHDNPRTTAAELIRYDACVPLLSCADLEPASTISRQTLPAGAWAVHTHVGAYDHMGDVIACLHSEAIPKRGLTVDYDRPFMAIYLNDPRVTREVHRRTELCIPVVPIPMALAKNDDRQDGYDITALARRIAG